MKFLFPLARILLYCPAGVIYVQPLYALYVGLEVLVIRVAAGEN